MKDNLQLYELTYIIPGNLSEDQHPEVIKKVDSLLKQVQAEVISTEDLGRRKLAYPIKHLRHGFYQTLIFNLAPQKLKELEKELKLTANILRFLIIKTRKRSEAEIAQQEKVKAKRVEDKLAEKTKAEEKKEVKVQKKKVSLEDLDKKLDELLDDEVL